MQFGNSAGNFGGSTFRRPFGHDSAGGLSKLIALLPNFMQIVHNWSEKGVYDGCCEKTDTCRTRAQIRLFCRPGNRIIGG